MMTTYADLCEKEELTEEKLIEIFNQMKLNREKMLYPENPKKINKWIEKIMNRLGWYRQKEIIIIREADIGTLFQPMKHIDLFEDKKIEDKLWGLTEFYFRGFK